MARMRSPKDWFPTSGEARGLVEIKGRVGGKGASRMRRFKKRGMPPNMKSAQMALANVNWEMDKPNLIWRGNAVDAPVTKRLLTVAGGSLGEGEAQPSVVVKKLMLELSFMAGIGKARVNGTLSDNGAAVRDDIPQPGIGIDSSGYTGALLSGTIDNTALDGPTSWVEGLPFNLWLGYETASESAEDPDTYYGTFSQLTQQRNKTVFWSRHCCPTAYNPTIVRLTKTFPGRGVRLSNAGKRELGAITLFCGGYSPMGTTVFPVLTMAVSTAKVWYTEAD